MQTNKVYKKENTDKKLSWLYLKEFAEIPLYSIIYFTAITELPPRVWGILLGARNTPLSRTDITLAREAFTVSSSFSIWVYASWKRIQEKNPRFVPKVT